MLTKEQAEQRGNLLFNKMRGEGWKLRVWENFGWHYSVYNGAINVHVATLGAAPDGSEDTFSCLMGMDRDKERSGGHPEWTTHFSSVYPIEVILDQIREARKVLNVYIKAVEHIEGVMGIEP